MTLQEQYELVKKAVDNNHLKELLLGAPGYEWGNLKHIPANVATDIGAIIDHGFYPIYINGNIQIPKLIISVIDELITGSPIEIWTAYFILRYIYRNELTNASPFYVVDKQLCQRVSDAVKNNADNLSAYKNGVGNSYPDGLLGDIQRLDRILLSKYGVSIL